MQLNSDFTQRACVVDRENVWRPSPAPGVDRKMLDRIGDEVARATTIVRYAPGSKFPQHTHHGGEEYIVLEGVFQDEHGDYPVGTYVRNPPTSFHSPSAAAGSTIFVKLWQFDPEDRHRINVQMDALERKQHPEHDGISFVSLFQDEREIVQKEFWKPGTSASLSTDGGAELLVLAGSLIENGETFTKYDWLRLPHNYENKLEAGSSGAEFWIKYGHVKSASAPAP